MSTQLMAAFESFVNSKAANKPKKVIALSSASFDLISALTKLGYLVVLKGRK